MMLTDSLLANLDKMKADIAAATGTACKDIEDAISELNAGTALYQDRTASIAQQSMNATSEYVTTITGVMAKLAAIKKAMASAPKQESVTAKAGKVLGIAKAA